MQDESLARLNLVVLHFVSFQNDSIRDKFGRRDVDADMVAYFCEHTTRDARHSDTLNFKCSQVTTFGENYRSAALPWSQLLCELFGRTFCACPERSQGLLGPPRPLVHR
jgi:hypothetical protein